MGLAIKEYGDVATEDIAADDVDEERFLMDMGAIPGLRYIQTEQQSDFIFRYPNSS